MRLIDADALKDSIKKKFGAYFDGTYNNRRICDFIDNAPELGYEDGILSVKNAIRMAIELEEAYNNGWSDGFSEGRDEGPQGEWIFHKDFDENCRYGCNQCGNLNNINSNFCPNCGAKMKEVHKNGDDK